jgi:serine/threonine-protein kinase/endoribonuclease IRE1
MTSLRRLALAFLALNSFPAATPQQRQQDVSSSSSSSSVLHSSSPQENAALHHPVLTPLSSLPDSERAVATRAPAAFGKQKAAVEAPSPAREPAAASGAKRELAKGARSLRDWEVDKFVLLATVDGSIYARDRRTGMELWKFHSEQPLVQTTYDHHGLSLEDQWKWIVEPNKDGNIYVFNPGPNRGIQKLGPTVKELADLSPWISEDSPFVYTASKSSSLITLNATNGRAIKYFEAGRSGIVDDRSCYSVKRLDMEEENECEPTPTIHLGRTEYKVSIQDRISGTAVCNIMYSEWTPNQRDRDLNDQYSSTLDKKYIYSTFSGDIVALQYRGQEVDDKPLYRHKFASPVVRVFDVVRPQGVESQDIPLVLLPQPVAPRIAKSQIEDVFVNCTETGSWYALSESSYPSVTDGATTAQCYHDADQSFEAAGLVGVHSLRENQHQQPNLMIGAPEIPSLSEIVPEPTRPSNAMGDPPLTIQPPSVQEPNSSVLSRFTLTSAAALALLLLFLLRGNFNLRISPDKIGAPLEAAPLVKEESILETPTPPQTVLRVRFVEPLPEDIISDKTTAEEQSDDSKQGVPKAAINGNKSDSFDLPVRPDQLIAESDKNTADDALLNGAKVEDFADDGNDEIEGTEIDEAADPSGETPKKRKHKRGARGRKNKNKKANPQGAENNGAMEAVVDAVVPKVAAPSPDSDITLPNAVTDVESGPVTLKNIQYDPEKVLGHGSGGTVVYEGVFDNRSVAVKRMVRTYFDLAQQEINALKNVELSKHVIRYFHNEITRDFSFIAIEKCQASLYDIFGEGGRYPEMMNTDNLGLYDQLRGQVLSDVPEALSQLIEGLSYLHTQRIIHRDIKPQNILVAYPEKHNPRLRLVISDFGLCRTLPENVSTLQPTVGGTGAGTLGWKAPEIIGKSMMRQDTESRGSMDDRNNNNSTTNSNDGTSGVKRALDIFSMGCVFYYVATTGCHPFDAEDKEFWHFQREMNVKTGKRNFTKLEQLGADGELPKHLIARMLAPSPEERPSAKEVMQHPMFWSDYLALQFVCDVSDVWERECRDPPSWNLAKLESHARSVIGPRGNFLSILDKKFVDTLGKQRKYQGEKVLDLLRALRNKKNHYLEMEDDVKTLVGPLPSGYLKYWLRKFPTLLIECYSAVVECELESEFPAYFAEFRRSVK